MPTLIVTTQSGVRPLGVRGEPLHNAATQLRRVIQRRLGDEVAGLLADPQLHEDGKTIDWYADWTGDVRPIASLDPQARHNLLADVDRGLAEIDRLGGALAANHGKEHAGIVGQSLKLAARRPAPDFVFQVAGKPVVVCWGYEREDAPRLVLPSLPQAAPVTPPVRPLHAPVLPSRLPPVAGIPWLRTTLLALPLLALLIAAAWLLREWLPLQPALALITREAPPPPIMRTAVPDDPLPLLKASLSAEEARARALQIEMSDVEAELKKRIANCKPAEVPKVAPPPVQPPPAQPPQVQAPPPKPREPQVAAA